MGRIRRASSAQHTRCASSPRTLTPRDDTTSPRPVRQPRPRALNSCDTHCGSPPLLAGRSEDGVAPDEDARPRAARPSATSPSSRFPARVGLRSTPRANRPGRIAPPQQGAGTALYSGHNVDLDVRTIMTPGRVALIGCPPSVSDPQFSSSSQRPQRAPERGDYSVYVKGSAKSRVRVSGQHCRDLSIFFKKLAELKSRTGLTWGDTDSRGVSAYYQETPASGCSLCR